MGIAAAPGRRLLLGDVLHVFCEHFIDKRLVSQVAALRFLPKRIDDSRVETNRNELTRLFADRRPSDASHPPELVQRRLWNV
jgi:hypothetical protein